MNVLTLAYLGDAYFELHIREFLIAQGMVKVNDLQKNAIKYVSAKSQAKIVTKLIEENFFTEEEIAIFYRARNHKSHKSPKNTDIITYKLATGLEAVIGHWFLEDKDRMKAFMEQVKKYEW